MARLVASVWLSISCVLGLMAAQSAHGAKDNLGRFALDAALGWNSDYGVIGGGTRVFLTENWDVHANGGADLVGTVYGAGTTVYFDSSRTTCWFFFSCKSKWSLRATALRSEGGTVSVTNNNVVGKYRQSKGDSGSISVGTYQIYGWGFTMGTELGYRLWWQRPSVALDSGTYDADAESRVRRLSNDAFEVALTIGWRL